MDQGSGVYDRSMPVELVKLAPKYRRHLTEMLDEWRADLDAHGGNMSPWIIFKNDPADFDTYLADMENLNPSGFVPYSTFFALDTERDIFVGAINIRHELSPELLFAGGHIGDGVRPSERRKGYATQIIALGLEECRKLGIDRVLICCAKDNIASAKSIQRNGGILENEVDKDGVLSQRYWIDLQ